MPGVYLCAHARAHEHCMQCKGLLRAREGCATSLQRISHHTCDSLQLQYTRTECGEASSLGQSLSTGSVSCRHVHLAPTLPRRGFFLGTRSKISTCTNPGQVVN
jgi:hypothetical protein